MIQTIDINSLRKHYISDAVIISEHAAKRFNERGIKFKDVRYAVFNGEIIEQYPDDYPFPSCLLLGKTHLGQFIHIVLSDEGTTSRIITAYYPDKTLWNSDFKTRKDV